MDEGKKRGRRKGRPSERVRVDKEILEAVRQQAPLWGLTMGEFCNRAVAKQLGRTWPPESQS